jgi:phenylacetate-CoA ligase
VSQIVVKLKRLGISDRLIRRNPLFYGSARRLLAEFDRLDASTQREWRRKRLRRVLGAAAATRYGAGRDAQVSLDAWPILDKGALRDDPEAFLTGSRRMSVAASTSGTSGVPLSLRRSPESVAYEQAVLDWLAASAGIDLRRCRAAVLRGDDIKPPADREPPFWRLANGGSRLIFSSNHLDSKTAPHFVDALREYAPEVILAYPTVLESLCSLVLQRGDLLRAPAVICGSEVLTRNTTEMAREALGARVIDYYGQAERVAFAHGDPERGYRFLPTYSINELRRVDSTDAEADHYEVIGTGLWNLAMPLVRYRTGDHILLRSGSDPQAVADGRETFLGIVGRSGDYLVAPSGARLMGIDHIPRGVPGIVRAQFIQEAVDAVTLLVVPKPDYDDRCGRLLLQHASLKLPPTMRIRLETTAQLARHSSGKIPLVIRKLDDGHAARANGLRHERASHGAG